MEIKKHLRKPERWQDFETLCKMLWGEVWQCPEIKKNGRSGQSQYGVDVYGIPKGETSYYGIQCKGKDDYSHAQLSVKEIDEEIVKARKFVPTLKKFYFATTADKDVSTEAEVRVRDLKSRAEGSFEIHIFSWDDIVELLDINPNVLNWYMGLSKHLKKGSASVVFDNNTTSMKLYPTYLLVQYEKYYKAYDSEEMFKSFFFLKKKEDDEEKEIYRDSEEDWKNPQPITHHQDILSLYNTKYNLSSVPFRLQVKNDGLSTIDDYKIVIKLEGDYLGFDRFSKRRSYFDTFDYSYTSFFDKINKQGVCNPKSKVLVPGDSYLFDPFVLRPLPAPKTIFLNWKLISRDFTTGGQLKLYILPKIKHASTKSSTYLTFENGKTGKFHKIYYVDEANFDSQFPY